VGSVESRLRRLEEKAPAREQEHTPAFIKLHATLHELAALRSSGAVHYRGGRRIEPEDIPLRELGPGYSHGQLYALAAERASARVGAEVFSLEDVPAAVEALVVLHKAHGRDPEAVDDRED
jgi:hypothetical protein